LELKREFVYKR